MTINRFLQLLRKGSKRWLVAEMCLELAYKLVFCFSFYV